MNEAQPKYPAAKKQNKHRLRAAAHHAAIFSFPLHYGGVLRQETV